MIRRHRFRAFDQVARSGIIAKPSPCGHDVAFVRRSQRRKIGPAFNELAKIRTDRRNRGLLQHDFGQPDMIGVGQALPRQPPPRQIARMHVIMCQKEPGDIPSFLVDLLDGAHMKWHGSGHG